MKVALPACMLLAMTLSAAAGQAPGAADKPEIPISSHDRFYTSDQFSNTVSVIDPSSNRLLGVLRLGDPTPGNLSPLYKGQLLVHGMGFSPDHRTLAVIFDRLQLGDVHRYRDQCDQAHELCRALAA